MVLDRYLTRDRWRRFVTDRVTIDTRSLAMFRILMGLLIIADVMLRSRNLHLFYTDSGVVPRSLAQLHTPENAFSVFYYTSNPRIIAALFAIHAIVAISLVIGYKTRFAMVFSFLLVVSLDYRNPFITSYADILFRILIFWGIFLPVGERWSVDAVHRQRSPRPMVAGLASFAFLSQMVTMYFINGLHKTRSPLWRDGTATPLILGMDEITFLAGPYVRQLPQELLIVGGLGWFVLLLGSPILLLVTGRLRYLYAFLLFGGHASFAVTVRIGAFAYVAIAGLLPFLQGAFYEDIQTLARRSGLADRSPTRTFDGLRTRAIVTAGRLPTLSIPEGGHRRLSSSVFTLALVLAVVGVLVLPWFAWAVDAGNVEWEADPDDHVDDVFAVIGVDQPQWTIFAPVPRHHDRYYVFAAMTTDGEEIDVYNDRPLRYDRPTDELHRQYATYRERFYMLYVRRLPRHGGPADYLLEHYCETWPMDHGIELEAIVIWEINEPINMSTITTPTDRIQEPEWIASRSCTASPMPYIEPPPFAI